MPNKTVTIHPAIQVPEGEYCSNDTELKIYCRFWEVTTCELYESEIMGARKCQPCKDACEREKETVIIKGRGMSADDMFEELSKPCETCGGTGDFEVEKDSEGQTIGMTQTSCPDYQPTERKD